MAEYSITKVSKIELRQKKINYNVQTKSKEA